MAADPQASKLTEAHRLAQARLGADTVRQMIAAWPLLDVQDLDKTVGRWLQVTMPLIRAQRTRSARLAGNYLVTFRALELGVGARAFVPTLVEEVDAEALLTSLTVTGPAAVKSAMKRGAKEGEPGGRLLRWAADIAKARSAAAAMRHVLNGGRETIVETVASDPRALGYARAASGRACAFCAMLASRGPVYSEDSVDFEAHDHCSCSAEPVYSETAAWPAGSERYRELWDTATADVSGDDAIAAFRQALTAA